MKFTSDGSGYALPENTFVATKNEEKPVQK